MWDRVQEECQRISGPGLLESPASFLFYTAIINALFVVKLYYVARDRNVESFKLDLSMHAVSHRCLLPPPTCANDSEYLSTATTHVI